MINVKVNPVIIYCTLLALLTGSEKCTIRDRRKMAITIGKGHIKEKSDSWTRVPVMVAVVAHPRRGYSSGFPVLGVYPSRCPSLA